MNKKLIALVVLSALGTLGGAKAADFNFTSETTQTEVDAQVTVSGDNYWWHGGSISIEDGASMTIESSGNNFSTVEGRNGEIKFVGKGTFITDAGDPAFVVDGGNTYAQAPQSVTVKNVEFQGLKWGIYGTNNGNLTVSAKNISISANEHALSMHSGSQVKFENFVSFAADASNGENAIRAYDGSEIKLNAAESGAEITANGGEYGIRINGNASSVIINNSNGTTAITGDILADSNTLLSIDSNTTINGNIKTQGKFDLNGTLNFNGTSADISNLTGESTINLFNKDQQLKVTNNGTLTIAGSGDLNDSYAGGLQDFYDTQLQGTNGENTTVLLKEGFYIGETFGVVDAEGKITNVKTSDNTIMRDTLDIAAGSTVMLNRILMNDVHKRMGDLRNNAGMNGAWVRYDGGRLSGGHVANKFNTIQLGADMPFADNFHAGVSASYTRGDVDFTRGGAGMDAYSLAAYGTWFAPNGMYADVVARYGHVKNELTVDHNLKGDLDNNAVALSGEFGWKFDVAKDFFVTPQVEATYMHIDSDTVKLGNKASYKFDSVDSFIGRAGLAAGYTFPNQKGNVFVKASAVHEFAGDSKVAGANGTSQKKDGEDTWVEFGLGAQYNFNKNVQAWANLERTAGADIEEDYRATVGARINF